MYKAIAGTGRVIVDGLQYSKVRGVHGHQQTAHCESLRKTMIFALANPWRILAKACETIDCESLRILAKRCETIFANSRESLRKPAKSYLRNLAKLKYFCECIFAKPCENTCISHLRILSKTRFAKPCERCIYWQPHPGSGPATEPAS